MGTKPLKVIIFLNGDLSDLSLVQPEIDNRTMLIGCDGGTSYILALGYKPAVIIGDFDSLDKDSTDLKDTTYVRYPTDKDYTDSELAIRYAAEQGCDQIILAGALGTRLDHLLGNILLLT